MNKEDQIPFRQWIRWLWSPVMFAIMILVLLCGTNVGGATASSVYQSISPAKQPVVISVTVHLSEFAVKVDPHPDIHAGDKVVVHVDNNGKIRHEFMVMPKGWKEAKSAAGMPSMPGMSGMSSTSAKDSMATMDKQALGQISEQELGPGQKGTFPVTFPTAGTYPAGCYIPGHEAMRTNFTVLPAR